MLDAIRAIQRRDLVTKNECISKKCIHTQAEKEALVEKYKELNLAQLQKVSLELGFSKTTLQCYRQEIKSRR